MTKLTLSLFLIFLIFMPFSVISESLDSQWSILLSVKDQWGTHLPAFSTWNPTTSPCSWSGIICSSESANATSVVTGISLPNASISTHIPPSICDLKDLTTLDLSWNDIPSGFPKVLYNCSSLTYLNLSANFFVGPIPDDVVKLSPSLQYLDLSYNNFSGDVPITIGRLKELKTLDLTYNLLDGSFPNEIANLSKLEYLMMPFNTFAPMALPSDWGRLKNLKYLDMWKCNLVGGIPGSFGGLESLEHLNLAENELVGSIPNGLFLLKDLSYLYLYKNKLSGEISTSVQSLNLTEIDLARNNLSGSIPEDFSKLKSMQILNLFGNHLSEEIPTGIGLLPELEFVKLFSNNLSGSLPPELGLHSRLIGLEIGGNRISGPLPENLCSKGALAGIIAFSNNLRGEIPKSLDTCNTLRTLMLQNNKFTGEIPSGIWTLPDLFVLMISSNGFTGHLPDRVGGNMTRIQIDDNKFSGVIPAGIGRWENIRVLKAGNNNLSGKIPASIGNLTKLGELNLSNNYLSGELPERLFTHCSSLYSMVLSNNHLRGEVLPKIVNLTQLQVLCLDDNHFDGFPEDSSITSNHLIVLDISNNNVFGKIPRWIHGFTELLRLSMAGNKLQGIVPREICQLATLTTLDLSINTLEGEIPSCFSNLSELTSLQLHNNRLTGQVPYTWSNASNLEILDLSNNCLSGGIPLWIDKLWNLQVLLLGGNLLEGELPSRLCHLQLLNIVDLSSNRIYGQIPTCFRNMSFGTNGTNLGFNIGQFALGTKGRAYIYVSSTYRHMSGLDLSCNLLTGHIPPELGDLNRMHSLNLSHNRLSGRIPNNFSKLESIESLDLSYNNMSGSIPSELSALHFLAIFNVSYNNLSGKPPTTGQFATFDMYSYKGNPLLCGEERSCKAASLVTPSSNGDNENGDGGEGKFRWSFGKILAISTVCILIMVLLLTSCFYLLHSSRKRKDASLELQDFKPFLKVSYQMLSRATNGFSLSNLIGVGGFGSNYKGTLHQDDMELAVAVKVMSLQNETASKSFTVECKALRNIRHRNLVKIITACSSIDTQRNDFKALVYEFMPKGSLESWLHSSQLFTGAHVDNIQPCILSLIHRLSIAIDVADALEYLHTGCASPIIHCDLKPSNILLDDEMTAHVGDFGLTKFLRGASTSNTGTYTSLTQVRGTVGYTAPEYGLGSKVSPEGDMYSFGIIVLEMMTSKKPTDPMFNDGLNLHDFAKSALPTRLMEIIDKRMLGDTILLPARNGADIKKMECIKSLMMIGVRCSLERPQERMSIKNVVNELKSARQDLLCGALRN